MYYQLFKNVILVLSLITSIFYSSFAAFRHDVESEKPDFENDDQINLSERSARILHMLEIFFEVMFLMHMILQFFLEYKSNDSIYPVRDLKKIALNLYRTEFLYNLIPLIPLPHMLKFKYSRFLYLIKCIRLGKTMEMLDIKKFMGEIRLYISKNLDAICQDENKKNDTLENHTNIDKVLWFKYAFKTTKLISIIILVSYFLGIFFYIFIEVTSAKDYQDFHDDDISESL